MTQSITRRSLLTLAGAATLGAAAAGAARAEGGWSALPKSPVAPGVMFATATPIHVSDVTLRVRDLQLMADYYTQVLGLAVLSQDENGARLGAGGVLLLTLVRLPEAELEPLTSAGLYHTAFLMPSRADLATWLVHAAMLRVPMTGFADHSVSEAIYLDDPEGNGIEVYADRAPELWRWNGDQVTMGTNELNVDGLIALTDTSRDTFAGAPDGLRVGHVHLRAGQIADAGAFYQAALGLDVTAGRADALFLSSGRYHHHLALNTWQSLGAGMRDATTTGLAGFRLTLADAALVAEIAGRLGVAGFAFRDIANGIVATDPWGTELTLTTA